MDHFVEYFLDSAVESMELDQGTATALRLYGDDREMLNIVNIIKMDTYNGLAWRQKLMDRRQRCEKLSRYADKLLLDKPATRCSGITFEGLLWTIWGIGEMAEVLSSWAIGDEVEGGYLKDFRKKPRIRKGKIFPRLERRLESVEHIRRCVKNYENEWSQLRDSTKIVVERMDRWAPQRDESIRKELEELMHWYDAEVITPVIELPMQSQVLPKAERNIIKRSLKVATSVIGEEGIRAFLRGEEIKLIGENAIVLVKKRRGLTHKGEGCLSVAIAERNGTRLADLCTYIPNTPTLDQLAGLALGVMAGHDTEILEKHTNVIRVTEAGIGHPLMQGRMARMQANNPREDAIFDIRLGQARAKAYVEKTKKHWIDALTLHIVPRRYVKVLEGVRGIIDAAALRPALEQREIMT